MFKFNNKDTKTTSLARYCNEHVLNPLSANPTKSSNILKQFVGIPTNCLSEFEYFVGLALKGLNRDKKNLAYLILTTCVVTF